MKPRLTVTLPTGLGALALGLLLLLSTSTTSAQRNAAVEGVEMALEGDMSAPRGGTLRWFVTAYEVRGLSELRVAADARVHAATSLDSPEDAAEVRTDSYGRALVEIPIPDDAPSNFQVILRLVTAGGRQRRFQLAVRVLPNVAFEIHTARGQVQPAGPLRAFGRMFDPRSRRPHAGATVHLTLRDSEGRPIAASVDATTDPAGLFAHTFRIPRDVAGTVSVEVKNDDDEHPVRSSTSASVTEPSGPPLLVAVAPVESPLIRSGQSVPLDVIVRSAEGRPIPGTTVTLDGADVDDSDRRAVTDPRGRARLVYRAPRLTSGLRDVTVQVHANREGWGSATGSTPLRIVVDGYAAGMAVEGGALSPTIGGRVWIRVVGADGRPAPAGINVQATGPRLGANGASAITDRDGVATLDVTLARPADATSDRCGGATATALDVTVGGGSMQASLAVCLPLDPDAAARVRLAHPVVTMGTSLEVSVERASSAARLPVELTVLSFGDGQPSAIAATTLAPSDSSTSIGLPNDTSGLVWVRARPMFGAAREVVRGGVTAAWVVPSEPATVSASLSPSGTAELTLSGGGGGRSAVVLAAPIDLARATARQLRAQTLGPFGDLRRDPGGASDALLFAALAARTPADVAAPAVLRGRSVVAMPAPANPTAVGLLRDPWRSRARFITGRLALITVALESYVANALPERLDDVADTGGRTYTFNRQILESVANSGELGPAGATGLGGDPLTIEQLQRFDSTLTYQNVARRITRRRLFRLILALRTFAQGRGFDLPWSRLGDPSEWMRQMRGQSISGVGSIDQRDLVDGWGRPFELRPARGGRSRFSFVDPLGAWEVVSSGPDGRFGSGDDQWDPTARVLRSGTPYAEAVGEDVLVARLEGVELGRASVELLGSVEPRASAGRVPAQSSGPSGQLAAQLWNRVPPVFEPPEEPLALRRPARPGDGAGGAIHRVDGTSAQVALDLDEEPRTWGAVVYAWTDGGWGAVDLATALGGAPLIVEAPVPERLNTGEPVELDLVVTNVSDRSLALTTTAEGEGFNLAAPGPTELDAGVARTMTLRIEPAATPGPGSVSLSFQRTGGEALRRLRFPLRRVTGDHPLRLRAAGLVRERPWQVSFTVPGDARRAEGRIVVLSPNALSGDPDLADIRDEDPALIAFSDALAGRRSDPELWATLLRRQRPSGAVDGRDPRISSACALVAWASAGEHDDDARAALARLRSSIGNGSVDEAGVTGPVLAALSAGGVPELSSASERELDPATRLAGQLRAVLRTRLRNAPGEPSLLARAAAGLLLADPRDAYGLAMLERALQSVTETRDGGLRVVPSETADSALESLSATFALSIAAHQAGRSEDAERLLRGGLARENVALRAGGEPLFWMIAAGAYGALGASAESVEVTVDGQRHVVDLHAGRGVIPFRPGAGAHSVSASAASGSAFIRVEAVMERPFIDREATPLALAISGDVGDASTLAAVELTLHANERVPFPVVDVQLPAGAAADLRLRNAIQSASGVQRVELREPGFLRVHMASMEEGTEHAIPLPVRWTVRGTLRGFGAVAYPVGRPGAMTSIAPQSFELGAGQR